MSILGERLKLLRNSKNLKQTDLAEFLNIQTRSYQRYESNNIVPNTKDIIKLADFYGVTTDYILGRDCSSKK